MCTQIFRKPGAVGLAFIFALGLAGCPLNPPQNGQFTSADAGNSRGSLYGPEAPTDSAGEGEGEGGGTPRTVVEPDVIRRDGNLLYVLNQFRGLSIVDLDSNTLLAQVPTLGFPRDLYLVNDRAYVLTAWGTNYTREDNSIEVSFDLRSRVQVVDVSDAASAAIVGSFNLSGDLIDSRLVGEVLYAVTAEYQWYTGGGVAEGTTAPVTKQQTSSSRVVSIAVGDPEAIAQVDSQGIPGYGSLIQATAEAIFVATNEWNTNTTTIQYIDISDAAGAIVPRGSVQVPGYLADRFKMDAYNGVLRVISNTWWPDRQVYVTTADLTDPDNIPVLGQTTITSAAGDQLFATRFDGPRAYVVTYFVIDPLHVIDLSDPANPKQSGELEVPGWSTHIEPQGDRLVALGVDDSGGERRVSVSLFDVSDPAAPALLDRESFGENWAWSNAFQDVKAFTVLDETLIVPFSGWNESSGGYERLQFLSYTRDTLDLRGAVDLQGQILRSLAYGDLFYAVTSEQVAEISGADLDSLAVSGHVVLAENISDVQQVSSGVLAEIITRYDSGDVLVRAVDPAGDTLGEIAIAAANVQQTFLHGESLVLLGVTWDKTTYESNYHVTTVDLSNAAAPKILGDYDLAAQPWWGGWWYDWYGPLAGGDVAESPRAAKQAGADIAWGGPWWWWSPEETSFVSGNLLIARCFAEKYDALAGEGAPREGLVIVDLDTGAEKTVGLAYDEVRHVDVAGGKIYLSTKESLGQDLLGRGVCAFYITELDPRSLSAGPAANVPGEFVSYDAAADLLLLRDFQYDFASYTLTRTLHSVRWGGGASVTPLDSLEMAAQFGSTLVARGGRIYHDGYDNGFLIGTITLGDDGELSEGNKLKVTNQWGYLIGASADSAYVAVAGSIIARYDFRADPQLADVLDVMATPTRLRFGPSLAYAPLGYSGLAILPL